jgi:hypothetical protein
MPKNERTEMKKQRISTLVLGFVLAIGFLMSSCTKQESVRNDSGYTGVYTLKSVNGEPVPANVTHGSATLQVRSGTFIINIGGKCSTKTVFVPPSGTEIAREVSATYTKEGLILTMQWENAGKTVGTIQGNTFTMDNEGMVFVYMK